MPYHGHLLVLHCGMKPLSDLQLEVGKWFLICSICSCLVCCVGKAGFWGIQREKRLPPTSLLWGERARELYWTLVNPIF